MHDPNPEILALLRRPQTREKGLRLLMQTYQERLYWYLIQWTKDHNLVDEALQNTFIKVYKNIDQFRGDAQLYTWLYRIASNEAKSLLAKAQRQRTVELDDRLHSPKADVYLDEDDGQALLQAAIDQLPEKQKQVFLLRYYEEMPYKDMAELLETSEGALKASYHHAVKKIEAYLKHQSLYEGES
jgi:RNA polymerase sigma-70 factor (ECF subfamily)